jgi:hypothetical protein
MFGLIHQERTHGRENHIPRERQTRKFQQFSFAGRNTRCGVVRNTVSEALRAG